MEYLSKLSYEEKINYLVNIFYKQYYSSDIEFDIYQYDFDYVSCYGDKLILHSYSESKYYQIEFSEVDGSIKFNFDDIKEVYPDWTINNSDHETIKTLQYTDVKFFNGSLLIGNDVKGYAVLFDSQDLHGQEFTKNTDFMLETYDQAMLLYDHNYNEITDPIGIVKSLSADNIGVWIEAELDKHSKYLDAVKELLSQKALGFSTGSVARMVKVEDTKIQRWPIVEVSLTTTPAEPKTLKTVIYNEDSTIAKLVNLKSIEAECKDTKETESNVDSPITNSDKTNNNTKVKSKMNEDQIREFIEKQMAEFRNDVTATPDSSVEDLKSQFGTLEDSVNKLLEIAQNSTKTAGYITEDGGDNDKSVKSFGDYLMAIKRNDVKRLATVYNATKDIGDDSGESGGYLVPHEYNTELLQLAMESSQILNLVNNVPVTRGSGTYPVLDQFLTPTAGVGDTAFAGNIQANEAGSGSSGGTLTETDAKFEALNWRLHKAGGYVNVDNELIDDSPLAIEALLRNLFGVAIGGKKEHYVLRGTGAGQPLGILNSNAAIGITPDTDNLFAWADASEMFTRFKRAGSNPVWVIHPSIWQDVLTMEIGSSGAAAYVNSMQTAQPNSLMGYSIVTSEHLPQADNSGCVLLADFKAYNVFSKSGLQIAFSEHAAFTAEQGTWRFSERLDGMPWLRNVITLADPQGSYTVSPFVYLND